MAQRQSRMFRFLASSLFFALTAAPVCAEVAHNLHGVWEPYSKNYWGHGDLSIKENTISWVNCKEVPFKTLRVEGETYYVELDSSKPCTFHGRASSFLILQVDGNRLEVSICGQQEELNKEPTKRLCSWGILGRKQ